MHVYTYFYEVVISPYTIYFEKNDFCNDWKDFDFNLIFQAWINKSEFLFM